jgi:hypothetical protein
MDKEKINTKHTLIYQKFLSAGCEWSDLPTNAFTQSLLRMTIEKMQSCLSEEQELEKQIDQIIESIPSTIETIRNWRNILSEILIALFLYKFSPTKPALLGLDVENSDLENIIQENHLCKKSIRQVFESLICKSSSSEKPPIKLRYRASSSCCAFFPSSETDEGIAFITPPPHITEFIKTTSPLRRSG